MSSRPKILFIITKAEFGGAQSHVFDLIEGFFDRYEAHLATGLEGFVAGSLQKVEQMGVPIHRLELLKRSINPRNDLAAARECGDLLSRLQPDLVHAHSSKAGVVARLAGRRAKIPVIFTAHGWGFSPGVPPLRRQIALLTERLMAPKAAKIICVSQADRLLALQNGVGNARTLQTIRYGLPTQAPQANSVESQPPRFLMVARWNEQKDQATLLQALAKLQVPLHVDFVGTGPGFEAGRQQAKALGLENKVAFLGDRADVPQLLANAQGFILSTHYEGLPISIMEAMRAGLPVLASDVSGIKEEVSHEKTGFLVPRGDATTLAQKLEILANNPQRRREMGQAARQKFLAEFTRDRMLAEIEDVYKNT